jgi:hypothetical protein
VNTTNSRDKILQKILKLRARAEDSASSEAEMNVAFSMAAKLMDSYNIEEAELALAESEGRITLEVINKVSDTSALIGKHRHKVILTLGAISKFTSTRVVYNRYGGDITFTGHRPDVELANYLVALIKDAMEREYNNYRIANVSVGYGAKASFQMAMAYRISTRLINMASESENKRKQDAAAMIENRETASSTALVVLEIAEQKRKEVDALFNKTHKSLRSSASFGYSKNVSAHSAGNAAGERIHLGHSIGTSKKAVLA